MPTLNWIGKDKIINHHQDVPYKVLTHEYGFSETEKSENAIDSGNLIINGDNLEALKSLLPKYEGKINCIYIDPPYNTGNENWVYNDNVNSPKIKKWLGKVVGKESEDLTRHDKWLCMMYPRLKLLHKLLAKDGVIFISINFKYEHYHLRCICNEIFGDTNYIGELTWESTTQPINSGSARFGLQQKVEPIIFFSKNKILQTGFLLQEIESGLNYPHDGKLGKCRFEIIEKSDAGGYARKTMKFAILGQFPREGKRWQIGQDTAFELEENNRLEIVDGIIKKAIYPEDELDKRKFIPFWSHLSASQFGTAQSGKDLLNAIMEKPIGFDTVKPMSLVAELLSHFNKNSIILDSFAGSGTTAHAVLNLNKQDGGNRKFILIEMEDYAETITAERVKRVIKGYGENDKSVEGTGGSFNYYTLGEPLFDENNNLNENISVEKIREYVWFTETRSPLNPKEGTSQLTPFMGNHNDTGYYFIYDKDNLTTLDYETLAEYIQQKAERYIIYADNCLLPESFLREKNIEFKKIPRDITRF
jgi:adenine-specific DNA-methyltransferase